MKQQIVKVTCLVILTVIVVIQIYLFKSSYNNIQSSISNSNSSTTNNNSKNSFLIRGLNHLQNKEHNNNNNNSSNICHPVNNLYNPTTGFNLTCPCNFPQSYEGIRDVKLFYHVGMVQNWEEIVEDQLRTIEKCGLGNLASSLTISYTNGYKDELGKVLKKFEYYDSNSSSLKITLLPGRSRAPYEARSINAIHEACHEASLSKDDDDVIVFYFHNKGASKYDEHWRDQMSEEWSYSRSLYWRKYMEYFTLERPGLCLNAFADGAYTCGVDLKEYGPHYSGNFWSASCKYIIYSNIEKLTQTDKDYVAAEFWLGEGYNGKQYPTEKRRYVGLFNRPWSLYRHLVKPAEYVIQDETLALEITSKISKLSNVTNNNMWDNILGPVTPNITIIEPIIVPAEVDESSSDDTEVPK